MIYTFDKDVYDQVKKIVAEDGKDIGLVSLHLSYTPLGSACPVTDFMQTQLSVKTDFKGVRNVMPV